MSAVYPHRDFAALAGCTPSQLVAGVFQSSKTTPPPGWDIIDGTSDNNATAVWPVFSFWDARTEMKFLTDAFGLAETAVIAREDDPSIIEHGEMRWTGGPGTMFGSAGKDDSPLAPASRATGRVASRCATPKKSSGRSAPTSASRPG